MNNMAMFMAAEKFLAQIPGRALSGRRGLRRCVKRLAEITVDPKTVTLSKKVEAAAVRSSQAGSGSEAGDLQVPGERSRWAGRKWRSASRWQ